MKIVQNDFLENISNNSVKEVTDDNTTTDITEEYSLRNFLSILSNKKELLVIDKKISAKFQLASIVAKLDKKEAILFTNIEDKKFKVVANILGTRNRFYYGMKSKGKGDDRIDFSKISNINKESYPLRTSSSAPFYSNHSTNLFDLPIITHFEKDAGPFITSSIIYVKDKETDSQNSSIHRMLLLNNKEMVLRMVEGRHLHKCFTYAKEHKEDLKINVVIGVHPAVNLAAAYQAAYGIDEISIANYLLGGNLEVTKNHFSELMIPKHSEIVLEGKILYDKFAEEWMVEMLRTYDFKRKQPVFEINKIWYRNDPIYYDILPGYTEHRLLMGLPIESKILGSVKNTVPTTKSVHLTDGGSNWLNAVIQIKKRLEGEPKNAILTAFSAHPSLKMATVVDDDINPEDPTEVEYAISTRVQADKDIIIITNVKGSSLDPSSDQTNLLTTKLGIDATASLLKDKERFEIAKIPGLEDMDIKEFI